eukprot:756204-Hanusia_phi.AAC.4
MTLTAGTIGGAFEDPCRDDPSQTWEGEGWGSETSGRAGKMQDTRQVERGGGRDARGAWQTKMVRATVYDTIKRRKQKR